MTTTTNTIITSATIAATNAAKTLLASTANATKVMASLQAVVDTIPETLDAIASEEMRLEVVRKEIEDTKAASAVEIAEHERKAKAELNIRLIENEDTVLIGLLEKRGLEMITVADTAILKAELSKAKRDITEEIAAAVKAAVSVAEANAESEKVKAEAAHSVEIAKKDGELSAANAKVEHLEATIASQNAMIEAERTAQTARFQATQTVVQQAAPVTQR